MNVNVPNGPPPPPAPVPPLNLSSIRSTYFNLFNQILDSSINIKCICKTTRKNVENGTSIDHKPSNSNSSDSNDFMDDDSEDFDSNPNDVEMGNINDGQLRYNELSALVQRVESPFGKQQSQRHCDLNCFENLKYIHNLLKNCFTKADTSAEECLAEFEEKWNSFKFLMDDPKSCDYYGTTIYHYAASDNNLELLKCIVKKFPDGVNCLDSKGNF